MSTPVVLITGALTGIGRAAAIIFAQEEARVVVSGRREKQGQELVAVLQGLGAEAIFVRSDVRQDEDVRNLVDQTIKRFGRLDIAVNNAGTEGSPGLVTDQTAESYAATFDTNVLGTLLSILATKTTVDMTNVRRDSQQLCTCLAKEMRGLERICCFLPSLPLMEIVGVEHMGGHLAQMGPPVLRRS
ncbi:MAG: SDR family NAD(P)-dependent oxidoreductase [Terriglobales bacterium]|jgi:NADP-dependent 3-hydroxy acid dehydrogenase YdfG